MKNNLKRVLLAILCGSAVIAVVLTILCVVVLVFVLSDDYEIREAYPSPKGDCQVEVVDVISDAKLYEVRLYIDYPKGKKGFPAINEKPSKNAVRIDEFDREYAQEAAIEWISDDTFEVKYRTYTGDSLLRVKVSGREYTYYKGSCTFDRQKSYFDEFEIVGDKVYEKCTIHVDNTMDIPVNFTISANDHDNAEHLLEDGKLTAVDESGNELIFHIEPNTSEDIKVTFVGKKGPEDTRVDRELPDYLSLITTDE